jgi:hypothetical protein
VKRIALVLLVALALAPACDGGSDQPVEATPSACGFPTPSAAADPTLVDPVFVVDGSVFIETSSGGGLVGAHLFVPLSVNDGYKRFRSVLKGEGFKIVGTDNEGFEAEIYFRRGRSLGAIQVRSSICPDATSVFLNLPK